MIGITHSADLDGICCAAILRYKYPDIELIGIDYGQDFPWEKIPGQDVIMADFSLQPFSDMVRLANESRYFAWIDHHKSAIESYEKCDLSIGGTRGVGKGACELLWHYLFPDREVPHSVYLLSMYDVWNHENANVLPFQYGMKAENTDPENQALWRNLFDNFWWNEICDNGHLILEYQKQEDKKYCQAFAFETELNGLKLIAINKGLTSSQLFDSIWNPEKYDAMCTFVWKDSQWKFSLYTDKKEIDVLSIAKSYGGGGHPQACGFQLKELPKGFLR